MKKHDSLFFLCVLVCFLPFFLSDAVYDAYKQFNASHGMVMSFIKFAILSTLGEVIGLRISTGVYHRSGFGILPRAFVWGLLGLGINMAFVVFSAGVPAFASYLGVQDASGIMSGPFSLDKVLLALAISVTMNTIFGPVFMTLHNRYPYSGYRRDVERFLYSHPYGKNIAGVELESAMGIRV